MLSLRAVEPDWLSVGDADGICEDVLGSGGSGICGHEAREEGVRLVGHDVLDRYARVVEG